MDLTNIQLLSTFKDELTGIFKENKYSISSFAKNQLINQIIKVGTVEQHSSLSNPNDLPHFYTNLDSISKIKFPERVIHFDFVPGTDNSLELYLEEGWQFVFYVKRILKDTDKFKIECVTKGMPVRISNLTGIWV